MKMPLHSTEKNIHQGGYFVPLHATIPPSTNVALCYWYKYTTKAAATTSALPLRSALKTKPSANEGAGVSGISSLIELGKYASESTRNRNAPEKIKCNEKFPMPWHYFSGSTRHRGPLDASIERERCTFFSESSKDRTDRASRNSTRRRIRVFVFCCKGRIYFWVDKKQKHAWKIQVERWGGEGPSTSFDHAKQNTS